MTFPCDRSFSGLAENMIDFRTTGVPQIEWDQITFNESPGVFVFPVPKSTRKSTLRHVVQIVKKNDIATGLLLVCAGSFVYGAPTVSLPTHLTVGVTFFSAVDRRPFCRHRQSGL